MSHRDEPRSGRGCFGAVVIVPFLALGGMFALIALTGSPEDSPLGAPAPARPTKTSMWWTEPLETPTNTLETVVVGAQRKDMRGALFATTSRVSTTTLPATSTSDSSTSRPQPTGRNESPTSTSAPQVPGEPTELEPTQPPASSASSSVTQPPSPPSSAPAEPPVTSEPAEPPTTEVPATSTPCPRSETPSPTPSPAPEPSLEPSAPVETSTPAPSAPSVAGQ
ncbi:hypothetical protein FKR81_27640 [Lentzea tibetensis]|uniref:Uncharacterized protein n=1 Tax=Lentzea tibetensis TaxID=2591470 RepID=A0A563EPR3_9PSEU|nr:hypothetical protein [Lentzea tibetensis]TWP48697.1 hypothetical protein FKR81_27640 [Lentzea tibetensis]